MLYKQRLIAKNLHCRHQLPDLRGQEIAYRTLDWTADGRRHPAVTPNPAMCSKHRSMPQRQQMSAFMCRWKHEIHIALFR